MKSRIIITAIFCISLASCTTSPEKVSFVLAGVSSGMIGCPSDTIKIIDKPIVIGGLHEWVAECNGKKFACSHIHGGGTNCTEMVSQPVAHEPVATGDVIDPAECLSRKRYNATLICSTK